MTISSYDEVRFSAISENLKVIRENIGNSAVSAGRKPEDIRLMAVTKTVDVKYINYSIDCCGVDLIGENKVQEYLSKKEFLPLEKIEKHLIGHLQTNKVKKIVGEVDMIQSADSPRLCKAISDESGKICKICPVLLEVNIGGEDSKTGFDEGAFVDSLEEISQLPNITVKGLMTIPPISDVTAVLERYFDKMNEYFHTLKEKNLKNFDLQILSMGMSGDYELAVKHGSNLVRIGSSIYGARNYNI